MHGYFAGRRKMFCFLAGLALSTSLLHAEEKTISTWVSFDTISPSPVSRPLDALSGLNAMACSPNIQNVLRPAKDSSGRQAVRWRVTSAGDEKGWAIFRMGLPANPNDLCGVRYHIYSEQETNLTFERYTGAPNFYTARRTATGGKRILAGKQIIEIQWSNEAPGHITNGIGFSAPTIPFELLIYKIEFIFKNASAATKFEEDRRQKLVIAQDTMRRWIADRGIKLIAPPSEPSESWERRAWSAVHLLAAGEQIDYWNDLLKAKKLDSASLAELRTQQTVLINRLEKAINTTDSDTEISQLQARLDQCIDKALAEIPIENRRWKPGADKRFYQPDGQPYRMYGPFFFRSIFPPPSDGDTSGLWRPWDVRYLSALGFNGLRLDVQWNHLEPTQGKFNPAYLNMLKEIMREGERYGLGVSIDLHWTYPSWFTKGKPGYEPDKKDIEQANSYQWPEAVIDTWRRLAAEFKECPNIVAFEVPTNETPIAKGPKGVKAYPALMEAWNQWLKRTYISRDKLATAWGGTSESNRYRLRDDEDWDQNSINPLGYQNDPTPDVAYANNPRLWDHLRWTAWMQENLTGKIMREIRKSIPDAVGMMQRTIGDVWDKSAIPVDYNGISTVIGEHVWPGTHYGMGSIAARRAGTLAMGSYDSEQQMENSEKAVRRHVELGLGFCPFAFHARGGGGMLFSDDDWHMKPETAYLPGMSKWIRTHWPEKSHGKQRVAIVTNSRLTVNASQLTGDVIAMLEKQGYTIGAFESLRIVRNPELLSDYAAVVTESSYMDEDLLKVLMENYKGQVLLHGRIDRNAYGGGGSNSPAEWLAARKMFFKPGVAKTLGTVPGANIDLAGTWEWLFTGEKNGEPLALSDVLKRSGWQTKSVPGMWGEEEILGSLRYKIGDAWYRKTFTLPPEAAGQSFELDIGAIDDLDWVYINGTFIGNTTESQPNYWMHHRRYKIPANALRTNGINEIVICIRNLRDDGGIKGPVELAGSTRQKLQWQGRGKESEIRLSPKTVTTSAVLPEVEMLASVPAPAGPQAALIRHGRWSWWFSETPWQKEYHEILEQILRK